MMKELRRTYPNILAADCAEGALWCESGMNAADHGSRGRKLAMSAPRRAWVHEFFVGNVDAVDRRLHEAAVDWRADHDTKAFDSTLGYRVGGLQIRHRALLVATPSRARRLICVSVRRVRARGPKSWSGSGCA